jgi:hypothetical protein
LESILFILRNDFFGNLALMKLRFLFILFVAIVPAVTIIAREPIYNQRLTIDDFRSTSYPKDTIIKSQMLKGGYRLAYRHNDSINYLAIEKGTMSNELGEGEADASMPLETLGYLYVDFENYFAIVIHTDVKPLKVSIYDKTGRLLVYGLTPFYVDTVKGLLMYEGAYGKKGKLILFNANTGKAQLLDAPTDTDCFGYCCWKVVGVTDAEIKIDYINKKQEKVVKTYERK